MGGGAAAGAAAGFGFVGFGGFGGGAARGGAYGLNSAMLECQTAWDIVLSRRAPGSPTLRGRNRARSTVGRMRRRRSCDESYVATCVDL